jgi:cytochrome b
MVRGRLRSVSSLSDDAPAVKTWRYLRVAMVVLAAGLAVSIVYELGRRGFDCLQTSISAYYYTPVQSYFVAALVGIGACLVCLKGSTDAEDILLNLAGMFAPVVAFVPTAGADHCATLLEKAADRDALVANNVTTLLAIGFVGLLVLAFLGRRHGATPPERVGFLVAAATVAIAAGFFWGDPEFFRDNAHFTAAVAMFACIFLVVLVNAVGYEPGAKPARNPYSAVALAMILSVIAIGAAAAAGWDYSIFAIESALIVLFAVFWVIQTRELWDRGLRTRTPAPDGS